MLCCSPAFRAVSKNCDVLPAGVDTGLANAMPAACGDGVYEVVCADGAEEFLLEDLQDPGIHISMLALEVLIRRRQLRDQAFQMCWL